MAKRENITSTFENIESLVIDPTSEARIMNILSNLKLKGRSLEKEVVKNIKNIVLIFFKSYLQPILI